MFHNNFKSFFPSKTNKKETYLKVVVVTFLDIGGGFNPKLVKSEKSKILILLHFILFPFNCQYNERVIIVSNPKEVKLFFSSNHFFKDGDERVKFFLHFQFQKFKK
jgi:hypothetical protein